MGYTPDSTPLDWTPCYPQISTFILNDPEVSIPDECEGEGREAEAEGKGKGEDRQQSWGGQLLRNGP